jgi:hypothetical protein
VSNTRFASCIVTITVDPAIMLLDQGSVESLLQISGVVYKAGREVLSLTKPEDFAHPLVTVEWLNMIMAPRVSAAMPSRQMGMDREMMRQMEEIYGRDYVRQMNGAPDQEKKDGAKEDRSGESPQRDGASNPSRPNRSDDDRIGKGSSGAYGAAAGGAVGGMGGMGMGGAALSGQEPSMNSSRLPGETDVAYRTRLAQARAQQKALQAMRNRGMGMGGMGAMSGGMMGGAGGMGGMVGAMGGYGGGGGMGFFGAPALSPQEASGERSATVRLFVNLPEDVPPRADEFLGAVVTNLRESLRQAYESCRNDIEYMLVDAKTQYQFVESRLDSTTGAIPEATTRIRKQLDMEVDVSNLNPQMPLQEAVEVLRKSVEPPLNIVVLWTDLRENSFIEPVSPINIHGMAKVKLGTIVDLLVKNLRVGDVKATWKIKDDVLVIGTPTTLAQSIEVGGRSRVEADAVNLAGQRSELTRRVQALELDLAGIDARREAIAAQTAGVRQRVSEKLSQDPVIKELEKLAEIHRGTVVKGPDGRFVPVNTPEEQEKAIRARIELANRREDLSKQVGGSQLEESNKELSRLAIDKAEKEAQLRIVSRQLDEVQKQLAQALAFDPEAARLRLAQDALDITGRRVAELQTRMANLQPPMVTMIGAN